MAKSPWSFKAATEIAAALQAKQVSSVELTQDAIGRIERHDGTINAICVRDFDRALEAARAADAAIARGESKPLLGLPLTAKESYNIAGLPTTWGFPDQKNFIAKDDALTV
ncbi:MAG: amidase, partial [Bradyrhizobium sp.]|nr:amidase [Bradyrhizobium sp.]